MKTEWPSIFIEYGEGSMGMLPYLRICANIIDRPLTQIDLNDIITEYYRQSTEKYNSLKLDNNEMD